MHTSICSTLLLCLGCIFTTPHPWLRQSLTIKTHMIVLKAQQMGEKHWSKDYGRTGGKGGNGSQGQHLFWLSSGVLSAVTYHVFCHIYFLFCWVKTMWLALRKPLSIKEHSRFPVLVSWAGTSLMLHFLYTFLLCMYCTTHSSYTLWYTFGHTLYDTFTTDISYTLTTHLSHALLCLLIARHASVASYPWASTWLGQSLDSGMEK